jgi:hypothetical protein
MFDNLIIVVLERVEKHFHYYYEYILFVDSFIIISKHHIFWVYLAMRPWWKLDSSWKEIQNDLIWHRFYVISMYFDWAWKWLVIDKQLCECWCFVSRSIYEIYEWFQPFFLRFKYLLKYKTMEKDNSLLFSFQLHQLH